MEETIIKISNLSKRFGKHIILSNINLDIKNGEIFGIIGSSGSGKTTMLNMLIGFLEPEVGDIFFRPDQVIDFTKTGTPFRSIYCMPKILKKFFGFAAQMPSFYSKLTVKENLEYYGQLHGLPKDVLQHNIKNLLNFVELEDAENILAGNLSGGMQRRLDIACALIHDPKVLIMDEPTADLDPILMHHVWSLIRKINKKGTTVILSSHNLTKLESLCDRIAILHNKSIVSVGEPDKLKDGYSQSEEIEIQSYPGKYEKIMKKIKSKSIEKMEIKGHKLIIITKQSERILHDVLHKIESAKENLIDVKLSKPSLQDIFLEVARKKEQKKE
jgi:ABC-2 type transport system ATP-binding protein